MTLHKLFKLSDLWLRFAPEHGLNGAFWCLWWLCQEGCFGIGVILAGALGVFVWRPQPTRALRWSANAFVLANVAEGLARVGEIMSRPPGPSGVLSLRDIASVLAFATCDVIWSCAGAVLVIGLLYRDYRGRRFARGRRLHFAACVMMAMWCFCRVMVLVLGIGDFSRMAYYQIRPLMGFDWSSYMLQPIADVLGFPAYDLATLLILIAALRGMVTRFAGHRALMALLYLIVCLSIAWSGLIAFIVITDRTQSHPGGAAGWLITLASLSFNRASPFTSCLILLASERPWRDSPLGVTRDQ